MSDDKKIQDNSQVDTVLDFIYKFKSAFTDKMDLEWGFLNGNCYWFAIILKERFSFGDIYYDPEASHFVFGYDRCADGVKFYDITGVCFPSESTMRWSEYMGYDYTHAEKILLDCIIKCD